MKKLHIVFLLFVFLVPSTSFAEFVATGKVIKFHVGLDSSGKENFAVYLQSSKGCPTGWYYSYNTYQTPNGWRMLFDLSMAAYEKGKTISIFNSSANCGLKRFGAIDTIN